MDHELYKSAQVIKQQLNDVSTTIENINEVLKSDNVHGIRFSFCRHNGWGNSFELFGLRKNNEIQPFENQQIIKEMLNTMLKNFEAQKIMLLNEFAAL